MQAVMSKTLAAALNRGERIADMLRDGRAVLCGPVVRPSKTAVVIERNEKRTQTK